MDEITRKAAAAVEEYMKTNQELNKTKNILGEIAKDKEKLASIDVGVSSSDTSKTKENQPMCMGRDSWLRIRMQRICHPP